MPEEKRVFPFKFVEVEWVDATSEQMWVPADGLPEPMLVTSRGWLVKETLEGLTLASSYYSSEGEWMFGESLCVPLQMVSALLPMED